MKLFKLLKKRNKEKIINKKTKAHGHFLLVRVGRVCGSVCVAVWVCACVVVGVYNHKIVLWRQRPPQILKIETIAARFACWVVGFGVWLGVWWLGG